jgi:F420-non-reducing hydrogenase iron-sulfur subunit
MLGFLCNWCCYAGADLAGVSRYQYPTNIRVIRLMCSGRVDMSFILRAFSKGVDGVFMGGCWLGECHYLTAGNYHAFSMMLLTKKLMKRIGIDPARLRLEWVSASQGNRFAEVVTDFTRQLKELGPLGLDESADGDINGLKVKLEAAKSLIPWIKLVERERLRVHFETQEEYAEYFEKDEVNKLFDELVLDKLARRQILLLLKEKPLDTGEIASVLGLTPAQVAGHLTASTKEGQVKFDDREKRFAHV